jgi:hypothetical protein
VLPIPPHEIMAEYGQVARIPAYRRALNGYPSTPANHVPRNPPPNIAKLPGLNLFICPFLPLRGFISPQGVGAKRIERMGEGADAGRMADPYGHEA